MAKDLNLAEVARLSESGKRTHILLLLIGIQGERRQCIPVEIERQEITKGDLTTIDELASLETPVAVENRPALLLPVGHPALASKERQGKEIGYARLGTDGDVEIVNNVLTTNKRFEAVEGDILGEWIIGEGDVKEIEIISGEPENAVLDK